MDNQRQPENDLLMPPYVYVTIIWQITSYSTLFILKSNTGNCFYLLLYVRFSGIFLEKVHQKTFRTTCFHLFTYHFLFGCWYTNGYLLTALPAHWKWRGTANWWEARLIEAWIIEVPLYFVMQQIYLCFIPVL
jgi:hypothetical protein